MPAAKTSPAPKTRKAAKGALTRERIIQLAAPVFNKKGYAGASMADLLVATGLQKGGLYNHFDSKEQLAVEAFDFAIASMHERWFRAIDGKKHAADRLLAVVSMFDGYFAKPGSGGCPLMNTAVEADDNQPVLRARARKAMDESLAAIRRIAAKGRERRELRPETDASHVATVLLSTLEGALMISKLYNDPRYLRQAQTQMTRWIDGDLRA